MTRAEQAAERVRKAKEKRAEEQRRAKEKDTALAAKERQAEMMVREVARQDTNKRRYHVGALADEAGLFGWSNADFQAVFAVLAKLGDVPNPGGMLEGVLGGGTEFLAEKLYIAPSDSGKGAEVAMEPTPGFAPRSGKGEKSESPSPRLAGV